MEKEKEICGNCQWHEYVDGDWYCSCEYSENFGCETGYRDSCSDYEEGWNVN